VVTRNHWSTERTRLGAIIVGALLTGLVTGHFAVCLALAFAGYCGLLLREAHQVETWLAGGAKNSRVPDTDGVIGHIEQLIYHQRRSAWARKKRLRNIVGWYNRSAAALPDATIITQTDFRIVWSNDAAERLLGISSSRDADQQIDNLVRNPAFQAALRDTSRNEELEIPAPRDHTITLAVRIVPYAENLLLFSFRDVSARVRLRETRQAFVANASHELKTPLTIVRGHLELLEDNPELPEIARKQVAAAASQTRRMTDLVADLLTLSKLENNELDKRRLQPLPMAAMITSIVADIRNGQSAGTQAGQHHIELELDEGLLLTGSESEIKSLCSNLIYNAVQHTQAGTEICVRWRKTPGGAQLLVGDNGPGIAPEHVNHITERFYRVDSARSASVGGTGLGLSIVRHIVNRHAASLDIDSKPGVGTRFLVNFPNSHVHYQPANDQ